MSLSLCGAFFLSGASALVFETLWFQQAGLAFGSSVWASSLVLSAFMGGLALGNALAARHGERLRDPLRVYALAEIAIAVSGVGLVLLFPHLGTLFAPALRSLLDKPWLLNPVRLVTAFVLLLVPSTAMGVTLPLLARTLGRHGATFGAILGRLYGWNTLGAVAGVLAAELWLIVTLGIRGSALAAAALNIVAAGVAWRLSRLETSRSLPPKGGSHRSGSTPLQGGNQTAGSTPPEGGSHTGRHASAPEKRMWLPASAGSGPWLAAAFFTGFALLALEVVWFRILLLVVDGHAAAFAVMLAVVLAGIAFGGLAAGRWLRRDVDVHAVSASAALTASVLCVISYAILPWVMRPFALRLASAPLDIAQVAVPLMLPVSFVSGAFFTLAGAALRALLPSDTEAAGRLTLANTIGAAAGALVGGFLLLPIAGMERSILIVAALYGLVGAGLAATASSSRRRVYAFGIACAASLALFPFGTMRDEILPIPVSRHLGLRNGKDDARAPTARVVAVREGVNETIQYVEMSFLGRPLFHQLLTNAVSMADTEYFSRRYMKLYVYWPAAVHPSPSRALLICYGVGSTARAMTDSSDFRSIDIVDISRDVLETSRIVYSDTASSPLRDPRVRVHVEDGRYFLQASAQQFDLITAEPPPPTVAGAVNLYTREYFGLIRDRLADGGMTAYWLPLHVLSDVSAKAILRAFCDVFDDCSLWHGSGAQFMMIGTKNAAGPVTEERFTRQWRQAKIVTEMSRLGFERPEQLGALFIGDAAYVKAIVGSTPPLTDNYPRRINARTRSQAEAGRLVQSLTDTAASRARFANSSLIKRLWPERFIAASLPYFDAQHAINLFTNGGQPHVSMLHELLRSTTLRTPALWLMGSDWDTQRIVAEATPSDLAQPRSQFHLGIRLIAERSYRAAAAAFSRAEALPALRAQAFAFRVYALCLADRIGEAQRLVDERPGEAEGEIWRWLDQTFGVGERRTVISRVYPP
jgi:spermidine synthase